MIAPTRVSRRAVPLLATALFTFVFTAIPALAAEGTGEESSGFTPGLFFRWLNFAIVFGGIAYLIAKHGGSFFRANAKAIAASITEASAAKAEADRELHAVEAKIARLNQEIAELREAARRDSEAEAERLLASGRVEIEKIMQAARGELAASERAAQQELRAIAASMAVERAGALVRSRMNGEVRARIFHAFLGELGRSTN
ncbi:MAG: H+-transporting two-sector ATPase, subunit [Candidatus Acidoferrum typicum]|nr:H+-transporting two-sector ATPase, subunit [Candidatus Acidoferrum typicum]